MSKKQKTTKLNFSTIEYLDLDGKVLDTTENPPYKIIANWIYQKAKVLDLVEIAREINQGKEVEVNEEELADILRVVHESPLSAFVKKTIQDYMETLKDGKAN
jgi:hypothetical protein